MKVHFLVQINVLMRLLFSFVTRANFANITGQLIIKKRPVKEISYSMT